MKRRLSSLLVLAGAALLAGCGGDSDAKEKIDLEKASTTIAGQSNTPDGSVVPQSTDPSSTTLSVPTIEGEGRDAYVKALGVNLTTDPENASLFSAEAAPCIAGAWVDQIGVKRLEDADITPQKLAAQTSMSEIISLDLTVDEAKRLIATFGPCKVELLSKAFESPAFKDAPAQTKDCLQASVTEDMIRQTMAGSLVKDSASPEAEALKEPFQTAAEGCLPGGSGGE